MSEFKLVKSKLLFNVSEQLGALANAALVKSLIKVPAAATGTLFGAYLNVEVAAFGGTAGGASLVEVVEAPTTSSDGTARTPVNRSRFDPIPACPITVFLNTDATAGTVMRAGFAELGQNFCSGPFLCKAATNYLVRVTNQSGAALINGVINLSLAVIPTFDYIYQDKD
jgi:hypothetical protein